MLRHHNVSYHTSSLPAHSLNFVLYYEDWKHINTVFRDDGGSALPVTLDIFNETKYNITLEPSFNHEASASNCHFEFRWEKGVVSSLRNISLEENSSWGVTSHTSNTHIHYFFLYKDTQKLTLKPKTENNENALTLTLDSLVASEHHTGKLTNLTLVCGPLMRGREERKFVDNRDIYMSVTKTISVLNRPGKERLPLHGGFVSANTILNDGTKENTLTLRLLNTLNPQQYEDERDRGAIHFKDSSQLVLSFDYSSASEQWALCENGTGITVRVSDSENWEVDPQPSAGSPEEWVIKPRFGAAKLYAGATLELSIEGISTDYPSGRTHLYLRYQDIPSYVNGEFILPIEKTPLLYHSPLTSTDINNLTPAVYIKPFGFRGEGERSKPVGLAVDGAWINLIPRTAEVGIRFDDNALSNNDSGAEIYKKSGDGLKFRAHNDEQGIEFLKADNSTSQMVIKGGKIGIGITHPEDKLHLKDGDLHIKDGNLRINNGKIQIGSTKIEEKDGNLFI